MEHDTIVIYTIYC